MMVKTANAVRLKQLMRLGLVIDINCYWDKLGSY